MSHFIEYCKECGNVISQCRCPGPDKEKRYGVCENCRLKLVEVPVWCMPEGTRDEMLAKIEAFAFDIRSDWEDPRGACSEIIRLAKKLKKHDPILD